MPNDEEESKSTIPTATTLVCNITSALQRGMISEEAAYYIMDGVDKKYSMGNLMNISYLPHP